MYHPRCGFKRKSMIPDLGTHSERKQRPARWSLRSNGQGTELAICTTHIHPRIQFTYMRIHAYILHMYTNLYGSPPFIYLFIFLMFYLFLRQRQSMSMGGPAREGDTESRSRLRVLSHQHRARRGAGTHEPRDHTLSRSRTLNRLSHPGAPKPTF